MWYSQSHFLMGTLIFPAQHNGESVVNEKASETFNLPVDDA